MRQPIYYVNGKFVQAKRAALPLNDLGILRGYGVFDVLRTYDGVPFRLRDHVERLKNSARQIDLELPWSSEELEALGRETLARNDYANANIRYIVTGGPSSNFMTPEGNPSLMIMVTPVPPVDETLYTKGCKVTTTYMVRERPTVKSIGYIGAIMAVEQAKRAGALEALYKNERNEVTEGTRSNFFMIKGDQLITPAHEVLEGVTRRVALELAPPLFTVLQRPIHYCELRYIDEAFITSTTKELIPVVQIDDIPIGDGRPGPKVAQLHRRFQEYVRQQVSMAESPEKQSLVEPI